MSDLLRITVQRARKPYVCHEGRGPIAVGETYERLFQVFDGQAFIARRCLLCADMNAEACEVFGDNDPETWPILGDLRRWLVEECGVQDVSAWYAGQLRLRRADEEERARTMGAPR